MPGRPRMKLLIIEDSQRLLRSLGSGLKKMGHSVDLVADGIEGLEFARYTDYDVVVLDLMLPGLDGLSILRKLRALGRQTHILILSARDQVEDRVRGLQLGADDYMVKPFSFDELCARLGALARRRYAAKSPVIVLGPVTLDTAARLVERGGSAVNLTPAEYAILEHLALNRGRVISKERLLEAIHDSDSSAGPNVVEVLICNLRRKLADKRDEPVIATRRGYGYVIEQGGGG